MLINLLFQYNVHFVRLRTFHAPCRSEFIMKLLSLLAAAFIINRIETMEVGKYARLQRIRWVSEFNFGLHVVHVTSYIIMNYKNKICIQNKAAAIKQNLGIFPLLSILSRFQSFFELGIRNVKWIILYIDDTWDHIKCLQLLIYTNLLIATSGHVCRAFSLHNITLACVFLHSKKGGR